MDSLPTEKSSVDELSETNFEFETSTSTTQSASESPAASEQGSEKQKDAEEEKARKLLEEYKAEKAIVNQMLADGGELLIQARNTINQAMPILANHLNTLSPEKQTEFLNHVRTRIHNLSPPEVQELMDKDPDLAEKAWQTFLD